MQCDLTWKFVYFILGKVKFVIDMCLNYIIYINFGYKFVIYKRDLLNVSIIIHGKYLGASGVRRNGTPSSHIHDGPHHEFNERTPP